MGHNVRKPVLLEQSDLGPYCLQYRLPKYESRRLPLVACFTKKLSKIQALTRIAQCVSVNNSGKTVYYVLKLFLENGCLFQRKFTVYSYINFRLLACY